MLETLKKKALIKKLPTLLILTALLVAALVFFGPSYLMMLRGATYFEPLADNDISTLEGSYLTADVDTLIDYYAETVRSESGKRDVTTAREYLMPVNTLDGRTVYIGLEVPKSLINSADAVTEDTYRLLNDEDGSYEWDGSYVTVTGTVCAMDSDSEVYFRRYLREAGVSDSEIGLEDGCQFLPLVLKDGLVGTHEKENLTFIAIFWLVFFLLDLYVLIITLTGKDQQQIKKYIAAAPNPELASQQISAFFDSTSESDPVRMGHSWLMYVKSPASWVLAADDVVWAYQHTLTRKQYGIVTVSKTVTVKVYSASEDKKHRCHEIAVKNEAQAQEVLAKLQRTYPDAAYGYSPEMEKLYNADPAAFHQRIVDLHRQAATQAAEQTTEQAASETTFGTNE